MKIQIEAVTTLPAKIEPKDFEVYHWYSNSSRSLLLYRATEHDVWTLGPSGLTVTTICALYPSKYDEVEVDAITFQIKEISR